VGHLESKCPHEVCFRCGGSGHVSRECENPRLHRVDPCLRCGGRDHALLACKYKATDRELARVRCYVCGQFGHLCCVQVTPLSHDHTSFSACQNHPMVAHHPRTAGACYQIQETFLLLLLCDGPLEQFMSAGSCSLVRTVHSPPTHECDPYSFPLFPSLPRRAIRSIIITTRGMKHSTCATIVARRGTCRGTARTRATVARNGSGRTRPLARPQPTAALGAGGEAVGVPAAVGAGAGGAGVTVVGVRGALGGAVVRGVAVVARGAAAEVVAGGVDSRRHHSIA
jgi:hypothetical protein